MRFCAQVGEVSSEGRCWRLIRGAMLTIDLATFTDREECLFCTELCIRSKHSTLKRSWRSTSSVFLTLLVLVSGAARLLKLKPERSLIIARTKEPWPLLS